VHFVLTSRGDIKQKKKKDFELKSIKRRQISFGDKTCVLTLKVRIKRKLNTIAGQKGLAVVAASVLTGPQ
jgi:hypothetical protein